MSTNLFNVRANSNIIIRTFPTNKVAKHEYPGTYQPFDPTIDAGLYIVEVIIIKALVH